MVHYSVEENVLNIHAYGREGFEEAKAIIPGMIGDGRLAIREIVLKIHFARPQDLNGGDKLMSSMFAHSLTRVIAIVTSDQGEMENVNNHSDFIVRHGIQARAFKSVTEMANWVEAEFPEDAIPCVM